MPPRIPWEVCFPRVSARVARSRLRSLSVATLIYSTLHPTVGLRAACGALPERSTFGSSGLQLPDPALACLVKMASCRLATARVRCVRFLSQASAAAASVATAEHAFLAGFHPLCSRPHSMPIRRLEKDAEEQGDDSATEAYASTNAVRKLAQSGGGPWFHSMRCGRHLALSRPIITLWPQTYAAAAELRQTTRAEPSWLR